MKIRLGTFNCENLFLRYRFNGPSVRHRKNEKAAAYKKRVEKVRAEALAKFASSGGAPDWIARDLENFSSISHVQRKATAAVISKNKPDIIALAEVENMEVLRKFDTKSFFGPRNFPHCMLIDGNDPRGIDVAVMSRYPIVHLRSYVDDTYKTSKGRSVKTFSRDCLVVQVKINSKRLTLFINHFKSQYMDNPERRKKQATRVAQIVKETFGSNIDKELFAVVGDFNQSPDDKSLQPLLGAKWNTDVLAGVADHWTHVFEKGKRVEGVSQLDYILLSKALASKVVGTPIIERRGLARYKGLDQFFPDSAKRILPTVKGPGTEASDHCPVFVDLDI